MNVVVFGLSLYVSMSNIARYESNEHLPEVKEQLR